MLAYVLILEDLERRVTARIQAAMFARAMGNEVEIPDPDAIRARFDRLLCAEPAGAPSSREAVLQEAFGLSGG